VYRYRAYGDPTVELPWSEVTAISNEVTQYVLKDLNPGDQFEIQVCTIASYA
jgi:L-ascorbate metabolism protein UlaG (beta-lactamase superfamily)